MTNQLKSIRKMYEKLLGPSPVPVPGQKKKYFIINMGHQASGKSKTAEIITKYLNIKKICDINLDNIIKDVCKKHNFMKINCDELTQHEVWNIFRPISNEISDNILLNCIKKQNNIIWETTGNSIEWTKKLYIPLLKKYNYDIIIVITIVTLDNAIIRCKNRKQAANCDLIQKVRPIIYDNFNKLTKKANRVIIFDNNEHNMSKIVYDSDSNFCSVNSMLKMFGSLEKNGVTKYLISKKC